MKNIRIFVWKLSIFGDEIFSMRRICIEVFSYYYIKYIVEVTQENKSQKGLPLETKNTHNHENRRLGLIESLHMQHCSLQICIRSSSADLSGIWFSK